MRRLSTASGIVLSCSGMLLAQALFTRPVKVLGDPNFVATAANPLLFDTLGPNWVEGRELNAPTGVALDNSVSPPILYIADTGNNRVLGYRYATQLVAGSVADIVIGQVDMFSNLAQNPANGGRQTGLNSPTGLAVDGAGNVYVADSGNNRILRFPQPFAAANSNQFPTLVIGQKSLATSTANLGGIGASTLSLSASGLGRTGIGFDPSGNLWVADTGNNRVLRFPASVLSAGAGFPAADTVIGQASFTTSTIIGNSAAARLKLTGLAAPNGISLDSAGNLYVTDQLFRVVVYNSPLSTNQTAAAILGYDASATSVTTPTQIALNAPVSVLALTSGPIVADTGNNRLMVFPAEAQWPSQSTQFSPSANAVIGQPSFVLNQANQGNADASARTFNAPADLAEGNSELYIADTGNNRVLVFPYSISGVGGAANRVIGQLDFPYFGNNLVDGKGFSFPNSYPAGVVLDTGSSPAHLYVADTLNNRILGFKDFTHAQNGQPADLVIGQPDFNRVVMNYPSGVAGTPTASGLNLPTSLAVDSAGNIYVTDTGNSRVLRFPAPYASGKTALEAADLVLGQQNFTSVITDATPVTLSSPVGIALTSGAANAAGTGPGWLVVADSAQNRVLMFPTPFVSGASATVVLGQANFTSKTASSAPTGLSSPRGVAVDPQDRVLVADTTNARVQIFDRAANLASTEPPLLTLTGYTSPLSVAAGPAGDFWVADFGGDKLLHYPAVPNLAQTNDASDASVPALAPHSDFVDTFNNLWITDSINRVLYFAPQINLNNAATYSTRALSAGTITALFPTVTANPIAYGTASAPAGQFPLPTTLADTQITVGGTPVPLLYVSPGQDNVILPQTLPVSGTASLLSVRASTGQILGGAEIELAAASPGLFTSNASGSGQIVAVNVQDSSVNGPGHPVVRGQYVILYGTGVGPVPNPPADGAAASGQPASDLPTVLIQSSGTTTTASGGTVTLPKFIPATVTYSGLAPGFAGLWQINLQIPADAQSGGAVVIQVLEKDIPNLDENSTLTTTLVVD
jgi:uncharacterized protein (TIGR03437 family)